MYIWIALLWCTRSCTWLKHFPTKGASFNYFLTKSLHTKRILTWVLFEFCQRFRHPLQVYTYVVVLQRRVVVCGRPLFARVCVHICSLRNCSYECALTNWHTGGRAFVGFEKILYRVCSYRRLGVDVVMSSSTGVTTMSFKMAHSFECSALLDLAILALHLHFGFRDVF